MPALTRERAAKRRQQWKTKKLPLPGLGEGEFTYVRKLSGGIIRDNWEILQGIEQDPSACPIVKLIEFCRLGLSDKEGISIFAERDDDLIADWPFDVIVDCVQAIASWNGLTDEAADAAKN